MNKSELRKKFIKKRSEQSSLKKYRHDKKILHRLARFKPFQLAKEIFTYINHQGEVATDILIKKYFGKKRIVVPKVKSKQICLYELHNPYEFENGAFGIREPLICMPRSELKSIDIALIPGIAFDKTGHRIGFGGGYFDRFLKNFNF
ncbi:5-formyltetrahydrofolate cyclo-ligase [Candidatus Peregrinibacteria bacterium]|nr:5-formyltetrahydrofolate cyclo-ligase [Candidatus Peregrinibacteria bacterium]